MPITIGRNIASLRAQRQLNSTGAKLQTVFERLSSGQRINRASDDAAGLAIAESLRTKIAVQGQALRNVYDGQSVLSTYDSALESLNSIVVRQSELAEQAANGTYSSQQRQALHLEANSLVDEFNRIVGALEFNGRKLLNEVGTSLNLQVGDNSNGLIALELGNAGARTVGTGTFTFHTSLSTGTQPFEVKTGDFDGDGINDIASTAYNGGDVHIFIGNGDGNFSTGPVLNGMFNSRALTLADFNNDGQLDVVTNDLGTVGNIFLGNGDGTFLGRSTFSSDTHHPDRVEAGDLNADGNIDLLVASGFDGDTIGVLLGNGDGTFAALSAYSTGNTNIRVAKMGDFDGDGTLDAVSLNFANLGIQVFKGDGNGGLSPWSTMTTGSTGVFLRDVELFDFNFDGNLDILTVDQAGTLGADLFLGNGDGTFQSYQRTSNAGGAVIEVGDLNGDGLYDFAVGRSTGEVKVYLGTDDGSFEQSDELASSGGQALGVVLGDYNGDGVLDLVRSDYGNDRLDIFLADTSNTFRAKNMDLTSQVSARNALAELTDSLERITSERSVVGAMQSRLSFTAAQIMSSQENHRVAEGRIRDADFAAEAAAMVRLQILQESAQSILAQANQQSALVLQLL